MLLSLNLTRCALIFKSLVYCTDNRRCCHWIHRSNNEAIADGVAQMLVNSWDKERRENQQEDKACPVCTVPAAGEARQWSRRLERCGLLRGCTDTERVRVPCVRRSRSLLDARIPTRFLCTRSTRQGTSSDARPPSALRPARPQLCEGKKPQAYSVSCNTTLMTEAMTRGKHK